MPGGRLAGSGPGRVVFGTVVAISLIVLFAPAGDVPGAPPGVDKVVHLLLFLVLAATGRWAGFRPVVLLPALVLYGAGSEVLQGLSGIGRSASVLDWVADVVGALAGLALWTRLRRPARR